MEHLVFRAYAPFASWGDIAPGTHRPTRAMPTRSAILGLVAGALGVRRSDGRQLLDLSNALGSAVRVEAHGAMMSDYHTVQAPTRSRGMRWVTRRDEVAGRAALNTLVSHREYLMDSAYSIALWEQDSGHRRLENIRDALERPRFAPYFGRRSCPPALPCSPQLVEAPTLREAFARARFPFEDEAVLVAIRRENTSRGRVQFDAHRAPGYGVTSVQLQRDVIASPTQRTFHERAVHIAHDDGGTDA